MNTLEVKKPIYKYEVNQEVVYPTHGVGKIIEIMERPFKDQILVYYNIYIEVSDMTVMIPVEKADELGIRAIVSPEKIEQALAILSGEYEPVPSDWKLRYQLNMDLVKSGTVEDIATVVKTLYHRSKVKELPILERKLFDNALRLLIDEVASSLNQRKEAVEEMLYNKMEECIAEMKL